MSQATGGFGEFIRELRVRKRLGLREFCIKYEADPSNWSKVERGMLAPPDDEKVLEKIAKILGVLKGSPDWQQLRDLAFAERGMIPSDIMSDAELVGKLPLFFRTLRGEKPQTAELQKLAEKLKRS